MQTAKVDRADASRQSVAGGLALFVLVSVLWGIPYLFNDIALRQIGPLWIGAGRTVIAGIAFVPVLLGGGRWRILSRRWQALIVIAIVEVALPFSLIALGQQSVPSGTTDVLIALEPIFIALITVAFSRGRGLSPIGWAGLAIGFAGVGLLLGVDLTSPAALLIVAAALSYAAGAILISRLFAETDSLTTTAAMLVSAAPILVIVAAAAEPFTLPAPPTWAALVVLGLACSAAGFASFFALIKRAGPTIGALPAYASPIVALIAGVFVLGEHITLLQVGSCALILLGAALVMRKRRSPTPTVENATVGASDETDGR